MRPDWNEKFILDISSNKLLSQDVVIMFEILDFHLGMPKDKINHENLIPICWAQLRPHGQADWHLGLNKLQLWK